jgi:hypothetical protein
VFPNRRPKLRKEVKRQIEANHPRLPDGRFEDPHNPGMPIEGPRDYGHRTEFKYKERADVAQEKGVTWEDFTEIMNDQTKYRIEPRGPNRSGAHHDPVLARATAEEVLGEFVRTHPIVR